MGTIRVTLVKNNGRYIAHINQGEDIQSTDVPKFDGKLISTRPYSADKTYQELVEFGKKKLSSDLFAFQRKIKFSDIEFIEIPKN